MSTSQMLEAIKTLSTPELESLERSIRLQRLSRAPHGLSGEETRLFSIINEPLPGGEELRALRSKRDSLALSEDELKRLLELENEREIVWARKLKAVSELADLRGQEFEALYQNLGLALRSEN